MDPLPWLWRFPRPSDLPATPRRWFILDVLKTTWRGKDWTALLIDIDPEAFRAGLTWHVKNQSCFLRLGKHKSRDDAWDHAEALLTTRH